MKIKILLTLTIIFFLSSITFGSAKIAFVGPLSGKYKYQGQEVLNGINEVIENEENNVEIEIKIFDNEGDPVKTIDIMEKIIEDKNYYLVIGPLLDQNASLALEVSENEDFPVLLPASTDLKIATEKKKAYRIPFTEDYNGSAMADFVYYSLKRRNALVIKNTKSKFSVLNSESFRRRFNSFSNTTVEEEVIFENATFDSESIIYIPTTENLEEVIEKVSVFTEKPTILGSTKWELNKVKKTLEGYSGDIYITAHYSSEKRNLEAENFLENYFNKYSVPASELSIFGYDTMGLVASTIKNIEEVSRENVADYFRQMNKYQGITGIFRFDERGNPIKTVHILKYINGEFKYYQSINPDFMGESLKIVGNRDTEKETEQKKVGLVMKGIIITVLLIVIVYLIKWK